MKLTEIIFSGDRCISVGVVLEWQIIKRLASPALLQRGSDVQHTVPRVSPALLQRGSDVQHTVPRASPVLLQRGSDVQHTVPRAHIGR